MKTTHLILYSLTLALAGSQAFAAEPVPWKHADYSSEFKYFQESEAFTADTWLALPPGDQEQALREVKQPAKERLEAITAYFQALMAPWDTVQLRDYASQTADADGATVRLWLGQERAAAMQKKLRVTRAALRKAAAEGLKEAEAGALRPYLTEEAIADLRSLKAAEGLQRQADPEARKNEIPKETANATIGSVSGALGDSTGKSINKVFDGSTARGDVADPVRAGNITHKRYELPREAVASAAGAIARPVGDQVARGAAGALGAAPSRATTATTVKSAAPQPLAASAGAQPKSTAWTSDAYGYTITTADGRTHTFRDQKQAEAAIRAMPNGSVSRIVLYGHGSPGMQTVGNASYEAGDAADLLKGKMARGGVIHFTGCNTASIGDATLNPAVGLSMLTRRIMYFSLPYIQDRLDGVPADQARQQWDKGWNADLSRDTSLQMRGAIVCGYRTFGLVPGRMPGLTRLVGNQEATSPGYVAGKKVCYQDGREVPEP